MNSVQEKIKSIKKIKDSRYIEILYEKIKCDICGSPMKLKEYYNRKIPVLFSKDNHLIKVFFIAPKIRCSHCNHTKIFYNGFFENRKLNCNKFSELIEFL